MDSIPTYYDGSGNHKLASPKSNQDYTIKPEGIKQEIIFPCFPFLK
ncbi:hypothetical protein ACFYKX_03550 [Cytobacillus sp. FJAT-54145]|uniref:Uncharacterized protein n=1 Tax=Cytobacillus spartinae TaxID=3299023 RepID=A0ABW6K674_9BACI